MIIDFSFIFWIRFTKIKFGQLNNVLKNMLTSTNDIPQHKRVLRMKDNWEDDSLLSTIYYTYKANENYIKLKIIRYIKIKFGQLNVALKSMLTTTVNSPQHKRVFGMEDNWEDDSSLSIIYRTYKTNENYIKLKKIKQVHLELFKLSKELSKMYGIQAENTNEVLHTFYGQNTNLEIKNEVDIFTLQMMQHRTEYSAYGFFKLNCKHICSCIGTVTTYIVIMIQVTDSIEEVS
ncbi:PREDICTED: uncharacterized protein LOC106791273 [Polistes canadensis]|uniref:uncharacterized protein LOC106791273 n=1 Tax=Polistes canadensis TaxID=91411 RepID=UPI000718F560|nr:PREDICTED: uncharacterized protein LOC106791273 [Polistes canadensis]